MESNMKKKPGFFGAWIFWIIGAGIAAYAALYVCASAFGWKATLYLFAVCWMYRYATTLNNLALRAYREHQMKRGWHDRLTPPLTLGDRQSWIPDAAIRGTVADCKAYRNPIPSVVTTRGVDVQRHGDFVGAPTFHEAPPPCVRPTRPIPAPPAVIHKRDPLIGVKPLPPANESTTDGAKYPADARHNGD